MNKFSRKKTAFTLAETMIVLVVLGVIAMITVPALVNKHTESANKTKLKKAMAVYETALNKMVIENGIKDNAALYENANSFAPEGNCTNTAPYFKVATTLNGNICTFKAPDGLFWNISKINAPILAFNEDDLNNEDAQNRYQLVGHFDDTTGSLRVDDLAYETGNNKTALTKVYNFINNVKEECNTESCKSYKYKSSPCENPTGNGYNGAYVSGYCTNCKACSVFSGVFYEIYDEKGNHIIDIGGCNSKGVKCQYCEGSEAQCKSYKNSAGYYDAEDTIYSDEPEPTYESGNNAPLGPYPGSGSGFYSGSGSGFYSGSGSGF